MHLLSLIWILDLIRFSKSQDTTNVLRRRRSSSLSGFCQAGCAACSALNGCLSCKPRYFFYLELNGMRQRGTCLSSCPRGHYGTRSPHISTCNKMSLNPSTMNHQSLLQVSEEHQLVLNPLKRKRAQDDAEQNFNICPESYAARKRIRITKDTDQDEATVSLSVPEGASSTFVQLRAQKSKDLALSSQSDDQTSESTLTETKRKEDQKVANIWIIGSSYIRRGEMGAREKFGHNFGLNARVQWFGKGGMRWNGVLPRFYTELSTQNPPDILVVHAGGNDLGLISAKELSCVMKKDLMQLHSEFPSMTIVYSCINERQVWRYGSPGWINLDRKTVNSNMTKAADCFGGCKADCASCFSENFCTRCHPGHFLFRGKCERTCPQELTANTALGECTECPTGCELCVRRNMCVRCKADFFSLHGRCHLTCPQRFEPDIKLMQCTPQTHCEVGEWTRWGPCVRKQNVRAYRRGEKTRTRPVLHFPSVYGDPCPHVSEIRKCAIKKRLSSRRQ